MNSSSAPSAANQIAKWFAKMAAARAAVTRAPKQVTAFVAKQQHLTALSRRVRIVWGSDRGTYRDSYRATKPRGKSAVRIARRARRIARETQQSTGEK